MCSSDLGTTDCSTSAALLAQERVAYGPDADLEAIVVADAGHVLNLHRNAAGWFGQVRGWTDRHVGG